MPARMEFDFRSGRPAASRRRSEGSPLRLLLLGDFGNRGGQGAGVAAELSRRALHRVDDDTLDETVRRIAPRLDVQIDGAGSAEVMEFASLDDFHPDALVDRATVFSRLRGLRARLLDPARFDAAADELRRLGLAGIAHDAMPAEAGGRSAAAATDAETDADTLQRLLGRAPTPVPTPTRTAAGGIDSLLRGIVAPHVVPGRTPQQAQYVAALDAEMNAQLRRLLHAPQFQALESAWRGVQFLVSRLELGEELQLHLLDVTPGELHDDIAAAQGDPSRSALCRLLCGAGTDAPDAAPWSLLVCLFDVGSGAGDIDLLAGLGAVAAHAGAPFVAGAAPALFGCDGVDALADSDAWRPSSGDAQRWSDVRGSAAASWIGLVAPRLLLRLPYGQGTDPIERFRFEERPDRAPAHDTLVWGSGALAVALLVGEAFTDGGRDLAAGQAQDIADLPALTFRHDGEAQLQPCAEAWIGERAGEALLATGVMPLLSHRQRAAVRLLRMQSIAEPATMLAGSWV